MQNVEATDVEGTMVREMYVAMIDLDSFKRRVLVQFASDLEERDPICTCDGS